jgi:FkbM family methyltransferase
MFDPTPKSIEWVKNRKLVENYVFQPFGIDQESKKVDFYLPLNENFVSGSVQTHKNIDQKRYIKVPMKTLKDIASELGHTKIEILKMDIEGSEYDVLPSILESGVSIHQILIEFHARFFEDGYVKSASAVNLLKHYGYRIFAISDSFEEISFIKMQ